MKKLSLFGLLSLWLLYSSLLSAQNQGLDFYLYNSDRVQSLENNLQYIYVPFSKTVLFVNGESRLERRYNFNQESKNASLRLKYVLSQHLFKHSFSSDYESIYDASDLEPAPYVDKTASLGYGISYTPADSISLGIFSKGLFRREQDRYISGNSLYSEGYWIGSEARLASGIQFAQAGLSTIIERKKLAWETFDNLALSSYLHLSSNSLSWNSSFSLNQRKENIYSLIAPPMREEASYYALSDSQQRQSMGFQSTMQADLGQGLLLTLADDYSQKHIDFDVNQVRNNADYNNTAQAKLDIQLFPNLIWENNISHGYNIRDYNYNKNTRRSETRAISSWLAWEYLESDSLIIVVNTDIQIVKFPKDEHRWDNDQQTQNYRLGWKHYYKDRMRLGIWAGFGKRKDVYISSLLSANNKEVISYILQPNYQLLIGDRIAFLQSYQLQADYNNYLYQTKQSNSFYRQVAYKYNLVFDTYPFIARSQDSRWLMLPFRNSPHNALQVELGYAYEENQYADDKEDYYELHTKNRRYTATLAIRHDIYNFYWTLSPKYSWGTWLEYSCILAGAWKFNNNSVIECSISPFSEDLDIIDWRSTISLNLLF